MNKDRYDATRDPRTGRPPLPIDSANNERSKGCDATKDPRTGRPQLPIDRAEDPKKLQEAVEPLEKPAEQATVPAMKGVHREKVADEMDHTDGVTGT
jgi:hypothetical protein